MRHNNGIPEPVFTQTFETTLDAALLRDYLAHLPDFAEFEALDRAFALAATHSHRYAALAFLLAWPRPCLTRVDTK